ncbi:hypothetical protein KL86DYS1_20271 [uncultured Dysgonomonas sp.]|uniref:Uncharacterized protein n=1 Tax=uncultured Dysgonomonas sp. TaxID=206096 RepID=A0A212JMT7_9BACT|nr:hypothetical protein KL86DYS1_20271 [uncultured Dysgonomonas sp.]
MKLSKEYNLNIIDAEKPASLDTGL